MITKRYTKKKLITKLFNKEIELWEKKAAEYQEQLDKKTDKYTFDAMMDCKHIASEIELHKNTIISEMR